MSNIEVHFLGKEYSIPADLQTYLELLKVTEEIKANIFRDFLRKLSNSETPCIDDSAMLAEIEKQVGKLIVRLTDNGIYDRTVNDYLQENEGYKLISKVNKDALEEAKRSLSQQMSDWLEGYEGAIQKKNASVTGLGFSIWSSSFVNHAIYAAMEASKVSEQEKAATKAYQKDMAELDARLNSRKNEDERRYIANTYKPHMEAAITVFAYELLDTFISDLIKYGKLDKDVLNHIHIDRSNDLLKNLELSQNKEAVLHKAFEACPYNLKVYAKALDYNLLDHASYQTALYFKQGHYLMITLMDRLGKPEYPNKFQINYDIAAQIADFTNNDVTVFLKEWTKEYAMAVVKAYGNTVRMLSSCQEAYKIMSELSDTAILTGSSTSKGKARAYINGIVSQKVWAELAEKCGYTDLLSKIKAQVPGSEAAITKRDVDLLLEEKLYPMLEEARQIRENEITKKREDEARQRAAEAEKARLTAERNKKLKKVGLVAAIVVIIIAIASTIITKTTNAKAYQNMAGEFCVYRVINDDGEERDEFNWWLSIDEDGTVNMSSWSYAFDNTTVNSYSGSLKNKADFRKFEDYHIEDYCASTTEYEKAQYCYEVHLSDEWDEFDGYIVCWEYQNGKIVDVYCDDHRYSFVEAGDDYSFYKWEKEIDSDGLSKNVQKILDNINVSEGDAIERVENLIGDGDYEKAVKAIMDSVLSNSQKATYYDSLANKIHFQSFEVNALVIHVPEHWSIEYYSDPNIVSGKYSKNDTYYVSWYIKCMGTLEQVIRNGDNRWMSSDYSSTTIDGCSESYVRRELNKEANGKVYSVIDHYIVCQDFVYKIQYFAYDERFFEPEAAMLLELVEFEGYANAEVQAGRKEQTYINANNLLAEGEYEDAIILFEQLGDYRDSKELIKTATSLQMQEIEDYKASCVGIGDLPSGSYGDVKVYVQVESHIRNDDYYVVTEGGRFIKIWNRSSREELMEGEWITIYGYAYGLGDNMTIDVEYIDD